MWQRELGHGDVLLWCPSGTWGGAERIRNCFSCVAEMYLYVLFLLTKGIIWRDTVSQNYAREHVEK